MTFEILVVIGALSGVTTVLFGFGGGFVTVPVIVWADAGLGSEAMRTAVATSAVVVFAASAIATASTRSEILASLRGKRVLLALLAVGGVVGGLAARVAPAELGRWSFVAYLGISLIDAVARPGFVRPVGVAAERQSIRAGFGLPVGAVAAFLGVGGSVLTVPLLRRAGHSMESATALANPMTIAITAPAVVPLIASVDVTSAAALLLGATPVVVVLRRYGITIPDIVHARAYVGLIGTVCVAMTLSALY
ncbi:sulfite exporter TauE/SafE family protein [Mycobacterium dioxanotrophicus]|uniref:sulfite exporter TauE/SafE family protein n=1 Tax=Mycobacterium dioxanotrophicus TaxID=482462 RepID=UPI001E3EB389|nr:sulfite exporter TauE/SafE family protein [Mycobacterium dioxanotrophicus]